MNGNQRILPGLSRFVLAQAILVASLLCLEPDLAHSQQNKSARFDELMDLTLEELLDVDVVTAGKTSQKISDIPASTVIITRDEIKKHGYQTLADILQNTPGLYGIDDYGEGGMLLGVRGFWSGVPSENTVILLNGIPQTKNIFSNYPLTEIPVPVAAIDRIEIVRGPMSIIYGSGAFFGAINIITDDLNATSEDNIVAASLGSAATREAFVRVSKTTDEISFSANTSIYVSDGIDQPASKLMSDPSALESLGLTADYRTGGRMIIDHKYFDCSVSLKEFYARLVIVEARDASQFNFPSYGDGHRNVWSDYNVAVGHRKSLSGKLTLDTRMAYYKDRVWFKLSYLGENFYGIQQLESNAIELTTDVFYRPGPNLSLQAGLLYKSILDVYNMYDVPSFGNPFFDNNYISVDDDDAITSLAAYCQVDYIPTKHLHLVAGLRLEKALSYKIVSGFSYETDIFTMDETTIDRGDLEVIPRLAGIYEWNQTNTVKLLYGKAIKRPSFFQDYLQTQSKRGDLLSEEIETVELNFRSILSPDFLASVSLFHNVLDNLITRVIVLDDIGNYDYSYEANAGRMITNGMEFTLSVKPVHKLFVEVSGTYQKTRDKRAGYEDRKVAYSPETLGYLKVRYNLTNDLSAAINGQYVGSMETFWDDTPDETRPSHPPMGRIGDKVDGYGLLGLNVRYENLVLQGLYLQARVSNLFDSEIRYPTYTDNAWADKGTIGFGRQVWFTVGREF